MYCDDQSHKSSECQECLSIEDQRRKLRDKGLCFNCTRSNHRAAFTGIEAKKICVYDIEVSNLKGESQIPVFVTRIKRSELLTLDNSNYLAMIHKYEHLRGVHKDDVDEKSKLPVHLILSTNEYTKIKTSEAKRACTMREPVAEYNKFGWKIMSTGKEANTESMFPTQTTVNGYGNVCRMVLGLANSPCNDQSAAHSEFLEQLERSPERWYQTHFPWKENHPPLPSNEQGSLRRLKTIT